MIPIDARSLREASARLFDRSARIVGWGSGSVFDYFHSRYPVRLDYLIDNDRARWHTRRDGVEIVSPSRLLDEDPRETFVVIYSSAWPAIQRQLAEMGGPASLPASAVFADAGVRERLVSIEALVARLHAIRAPRFDRTVVVQGPVLPGVTSRVLQAMTALHPDNAVLLSTWDDTDPALLAESAAVADQVVTSRRPATTGIQNRNYQIVSTRAGIERAMALGATTILKTRTDLAVLAPSVFAQARWCLDAVDGGVGGDAVRAAGLRGRIIVPSSFTRKFLLYHPSDLVMLGASDDLHRYWSAPLDPRAGELLAPEWMDRPLSAVNMDGNPTESYLGLHFCRTLGRPALGTLRDSWAFYRDLFAVRDNDWFEMLWFKNLSIPDATVRRGVRQMVTQSFWQRLHAGDPSVELDLLEVDPDRLALRDLAGAA